MWMMGERNELLVRELLFRLICRHRQGDLPNIMLYCSRRGGSTWLLNILSAQSGLRYIGRTLYAIRESRWRREVPDLRKAANHEGDHKFGFMVGFSGADERQFRKVAERIVSGELVLNPTLAIRAPFFQRHTDRIVFQMTSGTPFIEWFDQEFDLSTTALFRHPIPTAKSIQRSGWRNECRDFLFHEEFCDANLTGQQVDLGRKIIDQSDGFDLPGHLLDWSLKMLIPYRAVISGKHSEWASLSYEQLVTAPLETIGYLAEKMKLADRDSLLQQSRLPSRSVSDETADKVQDPKYLLSRWRQKVDSQTESELMKIPQAFGIELYSSGNDMPNESLLDCSVAS